MSFPIEFAGAFVEETVGVNFGERADVVALVAKCAFLDLVVEVDGFYRVARAFERCLYIKKIGVGKAVEWEIGVGKSAVGTRRAVAVEVCELNDAPSALVGSVVGHFLGAVFGVEECAGVARLKEVAQILSGAVAFPILGKSEIGECAHILAQCRTNHKGGAAVALSVKSVEDNRENDFRGEVIVGVEIVLVISLQNITAIVDDVGEYGGGIIVMVAHTKHLRIDVEIGENHLCHVLIYLAVVGGRLFGQVVGRDYVFEFRFNPREEKRPAFLLREICANARIFVGVGDVAVKIGQYIITESAQHPHFGAVFLHLGVGV